MTPLRKDDKKGADMMLRPSDKIAIVLLLAFGAALLAFGAFSGFIGGTMWLTKWFPVAMELLFRFAVIAVLPLWLFMRGCGLVFAPRRDEPFIERWRE